VSIYAFAVFTSSLQAQHTLLEDALDFKVICLVTQSSIVSSPLPLQGSAITLIRLFEFLKNVYKDLEALQAQKLRHTFKSAPNS
jgi:hypothetical protein